MTSETPEPSRQDRYWAAIVRDHAAGGVDAVTRLADAENDALRHDLATVRDTLRLRTAALQRVIDDREVTP